MSKSINSWNITYNLHYYLLKKSKNHSKKYSQNSNKKDAIQSIEKKLKYNLHYLEFWEIKTVQIQRINNTAKNKGTLSKLLIHQKNSSKASPNQLKADQVVAKSVVANQLIIVQVA